MAKQTMYVLEAVNLFVDNDDPTSSKYLTLTELKLPTLEENFADHSPGGAPVGIEIAVGIKKLEPTFKLAGFDPAMLAAFGLGSKAKRIFTGYGVIRDKKIGETIEGKAIIEGRIGKIEGDAFKRGDVQMHDYAINEVTHYEFHFGGNEVLYWDFWTNTWRVDGVDQFSAENNILRIASTSV